MSTRNVLPAARRTPSDADWLVPASIFVALQYSFAFGVSERIAYPPRPPVDAYLLLALVLAGVAATARILFVIAAMYLKGVANPGQRLRQFAQDHWRAWLLFLAAFLLVAAQIGALTWLKAMLPFAVPFWADPMLAQADRAILGTDAWRLFHPLLEPIDPLIDWGYASWFPLKTCVLLWALSKAPSFEKSRALLGYFLMIGLFGVIGQYALSSAGPIFYARLGLGDQFKDLPISAVALRGSDYLWAARQDIHSPIGGGISAMPSVHVASSVWMAFACWTLLPRICGILATAFAVLVFVGSMYLGWHYFVDSVAGVLAGCAAWGLAGFYLCRNQEPVSMRLVSATLTRLARVKAS